VKIRHIIDQETVTQFYDRLVFPSKVSHNAYEELVDPGLTGKVVGDFGCGQSLFQNAFRKLDCDAIFLDIAPNALLEITYGKKILASLTDIPLPNGQMDAIFCIGVVHHIPKIEAAISELVRVLKPGGVMYLGVYADRTAQSFLRKLYDNAKSENSKKFIGYVAGFLIWVKNRKNGLVYESVEHKKRIDDLLRTPLVRYLPLEYYVDLLDSYDISVLRTLRISQMNILVVVKPNETTDSET
jgi:SAM-dependent methyltransferase